MKRAQSAVSRKIQSASSSGKSRVFGLTNPDCKWQKDSTSSLLSSPLLQVDPPQIIFQDIERNVEYQTKVLIKNLGSSSVKLKIRPPQNKHFKLTFLPMETIAPGLSLSVRLTFSTQELTNQVSKLIVKSSRSQKQLQVPMLALVRGIQLLCQPFVDFGILELGSSSSRELKVQYIGQQPARISVLCQRKSMIEVIPTQVMVQSRKKLSFKLTLKAEHEGNTRSLITIEARAGQLQKLIKIDISGQVIQGSVKLFSQQRQDRLDVSLKDMLITQVQKKLSYLINNSNRTIYYSLILKINQNNDQFVNNELTQEKSIQITPSQGSLSPFSKQQIALLFKPEISLRDQLLFRKMAKMSEQQFGLFQMSKHFSAKQKIYICQLNLKIDNSSQDIRFEAKAIIPYLALSHPALDFGSSSVGHHKELALDLWNKEDQLPFRLQFQGSCNFKPIESGVVLQPKGRVSILISFRPRQLGVFEEMVLIKLNQRLKYELLCKGKADQHNKSTPRIFNINQVYSTQRSLNLASSLQSNSSKPKPERVSSAVLSKMVPSKEERQPRDPFNYFQQLSMLQPQYQIQKSNQSLIKQVLKRPFYPSQGMPYTIFPNRETFLTKLTGEQLKRLKVGPKLIEFGNVCVNSQKTNIFFIRNQCGREIRARIQPFDYVLTRTSVRQMVIPKDETGGFPIKFFSRQQGRSDSGFQLFINEVRFQIKTSALVSQMVIVQSKDTLKFSGAPQKSLQLSDSFQLTNSTSSLGHFQIIKKSDQFQFMPKEGSIAPGCSLTIKAVYRPSLIFTNNSGQPRDFLRVQSQVVEVRIQNGNPLQIKCIPNRLQGRFIVKQSQVSFDFVLLHKKQSRFIHLRNSSRTVNYFQFDRSSIPDLIKISPQEGLIGVEESKTIELVWQPHQEVKLKGHFCIMIRGGQCIKIPVRGQSEGIKVHYQNEKWEFSNTEVAPYYLPISLFNESSNDVELLLQVQSAGEVREAMSVQTQKKLKHLLSVQKDFLNQKGKVYRLKILSKSPFSFKLAVNAIPDIDEQSKLIQFSLNFYNSDLTKLPQLSRKATLNCLRAQLLVSTSYINFPIKVLNQNQMPITMQVFLQNRTDSPIRWRLEDQDSSKQKVFNVAVLGGVVEENGKFNLRFSFAPREIGVYTKRVPIFIANSSCPFTFITLRGECNEPKIIFDKEQLIFPRVKVGESSTTSFRVRNQGYQSISLFFEPINYVQFSLAVEFPAGNRLDLTNTQIEVVVSFRAFKETSFYLKMIFKDDRNQNQYFIPISGVSQDNPFTLIDVNNPDRFQSAQSFMRSWLQDIYSVNVGLFPLGFSQNPLLLEPLFKEIPLKVKLQKMENKDPKDMLEFYLIFLDGLKQLGFMLNTVRPSFFLPQHAYFSLGIKIVANQYFQEISERSWLFLLYQVFRYKLSKSKLAVKQSSLDHSIKSILSQFGQVNELQDLRDGCVIGNMVKQFLDNKTKKFIFKPLEAQLNWERIFQLLHQFWVKPGVQLLTIKRAGICQILIFLQRIIKILPKFVASQSVLFESSLGQKIKRKITIKNLKSTQELYCVKYAGPSQFNCLDQFTFQVPPQKQFVYEIQYVSKFSSKVQAVVFFLNKSALQPQPLVFNLESNVTGRRIQKIFSLKARLYQLKDFQILANNKFNESEYSDFDIQIFSPKRDSQLLFQAQALADAAKKKLKSKAKKPDRELQQFPNPLQMFFLKVDKVMRVRKNADIVIWGQVMPLVMQQIKCFVVLVEHQKGEIQYQIKAQVLPPAITKSISLDIKIQQLVNFRLQIDQTNGKMQAAKQEYEQILQKSKKRRIDVILPGEKKVQQVFKISSVSKIAQVQVAQQITLNRSQEGQCVLPLSLKTEFICVNNAVDLILSNRIKSDVRRYRLNITSNIPKTSLTVELKCPSRQSTFTNLTVPNTTNSDLQFKLTSLPLEGKFLDMISFKGAALLGQLLVVKAKISEILQILFKPYQPCLVKGTLILQNTTSGQVLEVHVLAEGTRPMPQSLINLQGKVVNKPIEVILPLKNQSDHDELFFVQTDLPVAAGQKEIRLNAFSELKYKLQILPIQSGILRGSVRFKSKIVVDNDFWFDFEIEVEKELEIQRYSFQSTIRNTVAIQLLVQNRVSQQLQTQVIISSSEQIYYDSEIVLKAASAQVFKFIWVPVRLGKSLSYVQFKNRIGEKRYEIQLITTDARVIKLPMLTCQLGKTETIELTLDNPSKRPADITLTLSNPQQFELDSAVKMIPAESCAQIYVLYVPCKSNSIDSCQVLVQSPQIGSWKFVLFGLGKVPTLFDILQVQAQIYHSKMFTIKFKNPYKKNVRVKFRLLSQDPGFQVISPLLQQDQSVTVDNYLDISLKFTPVSIKKYRATAILWLNQDVKWEYPIVGYCQKASKQIHHLFKTKCRVLLKQTVNISLREAQIDVDQDCAIQVKFDSADSQVLNIINNSFKMISIDKNLKAHQEGIKFFCQFWPFKPFKAVVDFVMMKVKGGSYKVKVQFQVDYPQIDNIVLMPIQSEGVSCSKLQLKSREETVCSYKAYTQDTQYFTVSPKIGMIQAGSQLTLSIYFFAKDLLKSRKTMLIFETNKFFKWYEVRAVMPKYKPPGGERWKKKD